MAAKESNHLAKWGEIFWFPEGGLPPGLGVCLPQLVAKPDEIRMVRDLFESQLRAEWFIGGP